MMIVHFRVWLRDRETHKRSCFCHTSFVNNMYTNRDLVGTILDYLNEFPWCESYECKYCFQYIRCSMASVSVTMILRGEY